MTSIKQFKNQMRWEKLAAVSLWTSWFGSLAAIWFWAINPTAFPTEIGLAIVATMIELVFLGLISLAIAGK